MRQFVDDVLSIETSIDGDVNIFEQFETNHSNAKMLRKNIKPPSLVECKSIPLGNTEIANQSPNINTRHIGSYKCYTDDSCSFKTNRYEQLKRHTLTHRQEVKDANTINKKINPNNTEIPISTNNDITPSDPPQKKTRIENNQQTKVSEIIYINVNDSNNIQEVNRDPLDNKSEELTVINENQSGKFVENIENLEESLCDSWSNKIVISEGGIKTPEDGIVSNAVIEEKDLSTMPVADREVDYQTEDWEKFLKNVIQYDGNNQIHNYHNIRLMLKVPSLIT